MPDGFTEGATLWHEGHQVYPYSADALSQDYATNAGVLVAPVAGPPGTAPEVIAVHGGYVRKSVRYAASRRGQHPALPSWEPRSDQNEVLLGYSVSPQAPQVDADGKTVLFGCSVAYEYVLAASGWPTEFRCGTLPHTTIPPSNTVVASQDFVVGLR